MSDDAGADDPATGVDPAEPPAPRRRRGSGWGGCALWVLAFFSIVVGGCVVGAALRPDDDVSFDARRDRAFVLRASRLDDEPPCLELRIAGQIEAGQCGYGAGGYVVTTLDLTDGRTAVFAPVPEGAERVELPTTGGATRVRVMERKGIRWFLHVGAALVEDGDVTLLDERGREVEVPAGGT